MSTMSSNGGTYVFERGYRNVTVFERGYRNGRSMSGLRTKYM